MALWLELLWRIAQAALFRRLRSDRALRLPPVAGKRIPPAEQDELVRRCNRLCRLLAHGSRHFCWQRSWPLAVLLRHRGVPVRLNIGLMGLNQKSRGHCWLSLEGRPFNEPDARSAAAYPEFLGDNGHGTSFWAAAGEGSYTSRKTALEPAASPVTQCHYSCGNQIIVCHCEGAKRPWQSLGGGKVWDCRVSR